MNKAGTGKWAQTEMPIEARAPDCIPRVVGFFNGAKEIIVKAGETLKINVPFISSPKPNVYWSKVSLFSLNNG